MLQLNYLGVFELLLWFTLFHRPRSSLVSRVVATQRPVVVERTLPAFGAAALLLFIANDLVHASGHEAWRNERITRAFSVIGLGAPDVFNDNDLRLGDQWPVVYYGDREERLPISGADGERLAWIRWSDALFYGIANRWRNDVSSYDIFDPSQSPIQRLMQLTLFDHHRRGRIEGRYVIDYFRTRASQLDQPPRARFERTHIGSQAILCSGIAREASCSAVVPATSSAPRASR
jgi:hypothetical protein